MRTPPRGHLPRCPTGSLSPSFLHPLLHPRRVSESCRSSTTAHPRQVAWQQLLRPSIGTAPPPTRASLTSFPSATPSRPCTPLPSTHTPCQRSRATRRGACRSLSCGDCRRRALGRGKRGPSPGRCGGCSLSSGQPRSLGRSPVLPGVGVHTAFRGRSLNTTGWGWGARSRETLGSFPGGGGSLSCLGSPLGGPELPRCSIWDMLLLVSTHGALGDPRCVPDADLLVFTRCTPAPLGAPGLPWPPATCRCGR